MVNVNHIVFTVTIKIHFIILQNPKPPASSKVYSRTIPPQKLLATAPREALLGGEARPDTPAGLFLGIPVRKGSTVVPCSFHLVQRISAGSAAMKIASGWRRANPALFGALQTPGEQSGLPFSYLQRATLGSPESSLAQKEDLRETLCELSHGASRDQARQPCSPHLRAEHLDSPLNSHQPVEAEEPPVWAARWGPA